jgi:chemotaxis protein methyltransferase CheR
MGLRIMNEAYNWSDLVDDVCQSVHLLTGNILSEKQLPMVEARLKRRMAQLKLLTPLDYKTFWKSNEQDENGHLISLLTTHFTFFFREFSHFEWIQEELPRLVEEAKLEGRDTLKFWSAAASRGQEVWSLCMWLDFHLKKIDPHFKWSILGTDIDPVSIKEAQNGVYHRREIETAPRHLWQHLWVRGKGEISDWYKIKEELRKKASFKVMNLLDINLPKEEKFDAIFCRNVFIYFDELNQKKIASRLMNHLTPYGVIVTGTSETLTPYALPLRGISPSIYRQEKTVLAEQGRKKSGVKKSQSQILQTPVPLKVLCVEDSPLFHSIFRKILEKPQFEIIGMVKNGLEAIDFLKHTTPDVITLDLHMPEMDGLEFLQKSKAAKKIPVVVVSAVSRDHSELVKPLLDEGVEDFIEKPTVTNMDIIGEELKQKLKNAWKMKKEGIGITEGYQFKTHKRKEAHVVFNFSGLDRHHVHDVLSSQAWMGDEVSFIFNGTDSELFKIKSEFEPLLKKAKEVRFLTNSFIPSSLPTIWLNFKGGSLSRLKSHLKEKDFLLLEESSPFNSLLNEFADDICPTTSFSYLVDKFLGGE